SQVIRPGYKKVFRRFRHVFPQEKGDTSPLLCIEKLFVADCKQESHRPVDVYETEDGGRHVIGENVFDVVEADVTKFTKKEMGEKQIPKIRGNDKKYYWQVEIDLVFRVVDRSLQYEMLYQGETVVRGIVGVANVFEPGTK
ncbi:hypothetical protein LTS18_007972, partial [Coniosporium uncinatum]